jgi:hypothetical protein
MLTPPKKPSKPIYTFEPWSCVLHNGAWAMEAYNVATDKREIVAEISATSTFPPDAIADFIIRAVNIIDKREHLINEMALVLEMCLESKDGKLDWAAEHDAEIVIQRANARARI